MCSSDLRPMILRSPPHPTRLTRRSFLRAAGTGALGIVVTPALVGCAAAPAPRWTRDPFSLGVASGAPSAHGFVLWTRLAPEPLAQDPSTPGGMMGGDVPVDWEIAVDPGMRTVVRRGTAFAEAAYAYSIHAEIGGLEPNRPYWYRFMSGSARSRIGRARTLPAAGQPEIGRAHV